MIATVVLTTRHHRLAFVWLGAAAGFTVHVVVAVAAGRLFALLPSAVVDVAAALLFTAGAVILWCTADEPTSVDDRTVVPVAAALAATGGAALTRVLPVHLLRRIAAVVFLLLAVISIVELFR